MPKLTKNAVRTLVLGAVLALAPAGIHAAASESGHEQGRVAEQPSTVYNVGVQSKNQLLRVHATTSSSVREQILREGFGNRTGEPAVAAFLSSVLQRALDAATLSPAELTEGIVEVLPAAKGLPLDSTSERCWIIRICYSTSEGRVCDYYLACE